MAKATDTLGILKQNLEDAGCDIAITEECLELAHQNRWDEISQLLGQHKKQLLDRMHTSQSQIDCLDYLVYKIGKDYK